MRAIKTLREETHRRAEQSVQLKTHTEQHSQRRLPSQQPESEALFQQKLDRLVEQKREQQRRDRQCQQRLDALATQRQRVAALLRVHIETNEKLNNELVASSYPSANNTVSDEASKEVAEVSSRLNQDLSLQLVASFNEEVSKELGGALCRKQGGTGSGHQTLSTGRVWWDAAVDADAAAGEDAALAVDGGSGYGGWCNAAVAIDAADETGHEWWDVAAVVDTVAASAFGAECEAQCDGDEDDDGWFDVIAN